MAKNFNRNKRDVANQPGSQVRSDKPVEKPSDGSGEGANRNNNQKRR